jgi:methyl coenzyme M reductase subunit C
VPAEGTHGDARKHQFAIYPWRLVLVDVEVQCTVVHRHPLDAEQSLGHRARVVQPRTVGLPGEWRPGGGR